MSIGDLLTTDCPVCSCRVYTSNLDKHLTWHRTLTNQPPGSDT